MPCLTAKVGGGGVGWVLGWVFFPACPLLSSFVPRPFRVVSNLAASEHSPNQLGHGSKSQLVNEPAARTAFPGKGQYLLCSIHA